MTPRLHSRWRLVVCLVCLMAPAGAWSFSAVEFLPRPEMQPRPLRPGFPPRAPLPGKPASADKPVTVRYSPSARAGNMVLPAIWLGLPTILILALIIRSMKGD